MASPYRPDPSEIPFDWHSFENAVDAGRRIEITGRTFDHPDDAPRLLDLYAHAFKNHVRFADCIFPTRVDLHEARFDHSLAFENCLFLKDGLCLRDVHVTGRFSLRGCTFRDPHPDDRPWLDWRRLRTGGDFDLSGVTAAAPIDLYNCIIGADLRLDGLLITAKGKSREEVEENTALDPEERQHLANEMVGKALNLAGADIRRHVNGYKLGDRRMSVQGMIDLRAKVTGHVNFTNAVIGTGEKGTAVQMSKAEVGGSVFFLGTNVTGQVDLRAKVKEQVAFINSVINAGKDCTAVQMGSAEVGESVFFIEGTVVTGQVDLRAKVRWQVKFDNTMIDAEMEDGMTINMESAEVGGSVIFDEDTRVTGQVNLLSAKITGGVPFGNAVINAGMDRTAVNMESAEVGWSVFFHDTNVTGQVNLLSAKITGKVGFSNAVINAEMMHGTAVDMSAAEIGGSVVIRNGTLIYGGLSLFQARMSDLSMQAVNPTKETGRPKEGDARSVTVTGRADLRYCTVLGPLWACHADFIGGLDLLHAKIQGDLSLHGTAIGDECRLSMPDDWWELFAKPELPAPDELEKSVVKWTGDVRWGGWVKELMEKLHDSPNVYFKWLVDSRRSYCRLYGWLSIRSMKYEHVAQYWYELFAKPELPTPDELEKSVVELTNDVQWGRWVKELMEEPHDSPYACFKRLVDMRRLYYRIRGWPKYMEYVAQHWHGLFAKPELPTPEELEKSVVKFNDKPLGRLVKEFPMEKTDDSPDAYFKRLVKERRTRWRQGDHHQRFTLPPAKADKHTDPALVLNMSEVRGNVKLNGAVVHGHVDAEDATFRGELNMTEAQVGGNLILRSATIQGRVFTDETNASGPYPQVRGIVDARGAKLTEVSISLEVSNTGEENKTGNKGTIIPKAILLDGATAQQLEFRGKTTEAENGKKRLFSVHRLKFEDLILKRFDEGKTPPPTLKDWVRMVIWFVFMAVMARLILPSFLWKEGWSAEATVILAIVIYAGVAGVLWCVAYRRRLPFLDRLIHRLDRLIHRLDCLIHRLVKGAIGWMRHVAHRLRRPANATASDNPPTKPGGQASDSLSREASAKEHGKVLNFLESTHFSPAFYLEVEQWARAAGNDPLADEVFLCLRRRELKETRPSEKDGVPEQRGKKPSFSAVVRWWRKGILDFCFGYGVRPGRAIHFFILLWLLNWCVFLNPHSVERPLGFEVAKTEPAKPPEPPEPPEPPPKEDGKKTADTTKPDPKYFNPWPGDGGYPDDGGWGAQSAFFMAMRVQVPLIDLLIDSEWKPADRPLASWLPLTYENWAAIMRAVNLILVPLLIAGAAGFLKRRE